MDGYFSFIVSAPLTAGSSGLSSSGVRRLILRRPVASSVARSRKGH
jgi:hypothetical protein